MRLFVVGESSPDPDKWSIWSEWSLVIAEDADGARKIAEEPNSDVCEIPMDKPLRLVTMTEPNWGENI